MRYCLSLVFFLFFSLSAFAQPANDDCGGLVDLGAVPFCPDTVFYTNVDATEEDIGNDNFPTGCDNGDIAFVGRDVWFQFTTDGAIVDYTITCTGLADAMGSTPMSNPQVMVYRGDCSFDNLSLVKCGRALDGQNAIAIDVLGLDPNTDYFIRINDWSATATPNSGTFQLCIDELEPIYVMGDDTAASTCEGTLYDSGGEMGDYSNNENNTFTLCPSEFHECILVDVDFFNLETNFDFLNVYEGDGTGGLLIASLNGGSGANPFEIEASSDCITFEFTSDGSGTNEGFELTWVCTVAPCGGSSVDNPTDIPSIPFDDTFSTCGEAATIGESPCNNAPFLNGPDYIFTYDSPGDICASVIISGADTGTGVLVLNGPPNDPATVCVAQSNAGAIGSANFQAPGTYYIIVANAAECTDFNITIEEADCTLSPALVDALCNPLNGCQEVDSTGAVLPSVLFFEDGFQDIEVVNGVNAGCWFGVGTEPDFYWFTIEAQTDGPFGFILESADVPSDIDFNVWGPFTEQQVCDSAGMVISFIENNEPIRSSYAGGAQPTGLTDIHPADGYAVTDLYDCDGVGDQNNDDVVSTIAALEGEHYVVLANDWGNQIESGGIQIDWAPSGEGVLDPDLSDIEGSDTTICAGEMVQLELPNWITTVQWITNTNTLSCTDCSDPIATPTVTTTYEAIVTGVCLNDTIEVEVFVYDLDAGSDITVCLGQDVTLNPGVIYDETEYVWTGDNLSCTNCAEPVVTTNTAGTFTYIVEQIAANCTLMDTVELTVLSNPTPVYEVSDSTAVCFTESVELGDPSNDPALDYVWTSNPPGLNSTLPNPTAFPPENTTFYVTVTSGLCPIPSMDSVFVRVDVQALVDVANDTLVCQGEIITLGNTTIQPGVEYSWSPTTGLDDPSSPNAILTADVSETYVLTSTFGVCTRTDTVVVETSVISIEIENDPDSITICKGEEVLLTTIAEPNGITVNWTTDNGSFTEMGGQVTVAPDIITEYYATVNIPGCTRIDTFLIDVDSIPLNLEIMPADTSICEGETIILSTQAYQQADFPDIELEWEPLNGQQTPDSLLNMVITGDVTTTYYRTTTNGVCTQVDSATVIVQPIPEIFITPAQSVVCPGDVVNLVATSPDITEFTWDENATLSCLDCPDPVATLGNSSQSYTVEGEFEGCPTMAMASIQVIPLPVLNVISNRPICFGGNPVALNPMAAEANTTYTWTSEPAGFNSTEVNPSVSPTVTTTYFVTSDNGICTPVTDQVTIEVVEFASVEAGEDISICQFEGVELTALGSSSGNYSWSTGSTSNSTEVSTNEVGSTVYYVSFDNSCGPTATDSVTVTVWQNVEIDPVVPFSFNPEAMPTYIEGQTVTITGNIIPAGLPNLTYEWTFDGQPVPGSTNPIEATFINDNTQVTLVVTTTDGCSDFEKQRVEVSVAEFEMPNAFTPDGDGTNDYFNLISSFEDFGNIQTFQIYNRWGKLVYDNENPDLGWDGTFNGQPSPSDVYIYRIIYQRLSGEVKEESGEVTLIR